MTDEKSTLIVMLLGFCSPWFGADTSPTPKRIDVPEVHAPVAAAGADVATCGLELKPAGKSAAFQGWISADPDQSVQGEARLSVTGNGIDLQHVRQIVTGSGEKLIITFAALPSAKAKVEAVLDIVDSTGRVICQAKA